MSPKKPFDERLAELEAALPHEDPWTRPTDARIKAIESRGPAASYPPKSEPPGRRWTPAGVVLVLGAVSALSVTLGAVVTPLLTKPDLTGYVKEDRLRACETRLDERDKAHGLGIDAEQKRTAACLDRLLACSSQFGAAETVIDSLEKKRRPSP
ncbi:MAG TPA: hypothetical protein VFZ53_10345 [Polyangiaceae bacterium]